MKIALLAATGKAGSTILAELLSRGHHVVAIARDPAKLPDDVDVTGVAVDLTAIDSDKLADIVAGADAVVSAFGPASSDPRYTTDESYTDQLVTVTDTAIEAARKASSPRLLVVGGAGSLNFSPGVTVLDSGHWPEPYKPIAKSHVKAFAALRSSGLDWTYFSPPMMIRPGERTGKFRLGEDDVIFANDGTNTVSFEDYAVALVDELEQPAHRRARFTIGY